MDGKGDTGGTPDRVVARIAARQHGVVSSAQLRRAGITRDGVRRRLELGRLHRVHRGVFAVGHPGLTTAGRWVAAVLACSRILPPPDARDELQTKTALERWGAALSHRSAAELWGLLPATDGSIQVSVPGVAGKRTRRGVHVHRSRTLVADLVTTRRGIPVTTPDRTIADLRRAAVTKGCPAAISPQELRRAIRQANILGLRIGEVETDRTRSELERLFLHLCHRSKLPVPEVNVRIGPFLVDFLWRERRLIVETDGYRFHRGRAAFEEDRDRDLTLKTLGYEVIRLSYRQIKEKPTRVAELLAALLG